MKRSLIFLLPCLFLLASFSSESLLMSQTLQFCEDVSKDGDPINESTVFSINKSGGSLKCLTKLPYRIGTQSVSYEVYKIDSDGYESYDNTILQDVDPSWTWFFKEIIFNDAGRYSISVYDTDKNFLASAQIRIQYY